MQDKTNEQLLLELKTYVQNERTLIKEILEHLEEVELRRLYLDKGFSSMFAFCTEYLCYTPQEAMIRIQAMRLTRQLPDVKDQLQEGTLSLPVAAKVQNHVVRENKIRRESFERPLQANETKKILSMVKGKSVKDSEKILFDFFPHHDSKIPDKVKTVSAKQVRVEMNLSQTTFDKLQKIKALRAHVNPEGSWEKLIEDLCELALKKYDPAQQTSRSQTLSNSNPTASRSIPLALRRRVWVRDLGRCQHRDHSEGKVCGETFGAQVDHIQPWALGGRHTMENLRVLCWNHNRHRAERTFGHRPKDKNCHLGQKGSPSEEPL